MQNCNAGQHEPAIENKWKLFERKTISTGDGGKKVAIVGAGPAGLSCAHVLSREGVDVTVFEKESKGGGLMTYGIAAYKVTPAFCEEEVDFITSLGGIDIKYDHSFGKRCDHLQICKKNMMLCIWVLVLGLANQLNIPG